MVRKSEVIEEAKQSGKALKKARGKITQIQLSEMTGIDQSVISRIEAGKVEPELSTLKKLAEALNCKLSIKFIKAKKVK